MGFEKERHEPNLLPKRMHQEQWKLERIFRICPNRMAYRRNMGEDHIPKKSTTLFLDEKKKSTS